MGLSCGMSLVKYGLFIFNLVCAVAGIALIVVGAIPLFKIENIRDVFPENEPATVPIIVVALGSVIFIISFFGCCGAIRESQCMVSTYAFFLLVLVVGQIVLAVFAFMYAEELANAARDGYQKIWTRLPAADASEVINGIQGALHCCGNNNGPSDWMTGGLSGIPNSCCEAGSSCTTANSWSKGCGTFIFDLVKDSGLLIAWVAIVFGAFELVGVIFACCLANSIRNANRRQYA